MLGHEDYRGLRRLSETNGPGAAAAFCAEILGLTRTGADTYAYDAKNAQAKAEDFRIGRVFDAVYPHARELREEYLSGGFSSNTKRVLEAGEVLSSEFSNITGQIVYSRAITYFQSEDFVFTKEVDTMPSSILDNEKIAGIGRSGDDIEEVDERMPYPNTGPVEDFIHAPPGKKRGQKCALTWEAVFSDRTGQLLKEAGDLGYGAGLNKEKRIIDATVDENAGAKSALLGGHRYHWRNTSYATFQTSSPWVNVTTSNALADWTDIQNAEDTISRIRDPHTGEPIDITPNVLITTYQLRYNATYILNGQLRIAVGGYPTSGDPTAHYSPNFLPKYRPLTSKLLETRMATDTDWYLADLKRAVCYKENRPLKVEQAPAGHPDEFDREIVNQWKVSEFGNAFVQEARAIHESRA